jgi:hypothetical protein
MKDFIEQQIISAVRELLTRRVNEIFRDWEIVVPIIEFSNFAGVVAPVISLSACECSEKERVVRLEAYSLTVSFSLPETPDSELFCYGYSFAFGKALGEDVTLGGIVDRAVVTGKKYVRPKKADCGQGWEAVITLRITVEETGK